MIIYLVRHPETVSNKLGIIQGHDDSPLTKKGKVAAVKLGQLLEGKKISKIYSSDLGRCIQTSRIIKKQLGVTIIYQKDLRELNYGEYNGKSAKAINQKFDLRNGDLVFPGGESFNQMKKRVLHFIRQIKDKKPVLIVTHEGCLRAVLSEQHHTNFTSRKCSTHPSTIFTIAKLGKN